jgi:hypothetical protein
VPDVARLFPQARIQGKGLLATEGCVSLPLLNIGGAVPALRSHFLEFLPLPTDTTARADQGTARPHLVHELEPGATYAVVLTTGGGLYRYQLHDSVQVVARHHGCPVLRFMGKLAHISDHFGEKLNAQHVQQALDTLLPQRIAPPPFVMLACEYLPDRAAYILFIETAASDEQLRSLGTALEERLCTSYHYAYCRKLGQLAALRVFRIQAHAAADYLAHCQASGQRLGDIKPTVLHPGSGWLQVFRGYLVKTRNE